MTKFNYDPFKRFQVRYVAPFKFTDQDLKFRYAFWGWPEIGLGHRDENWSGLPTKRVLHIAWLYWRIEFIWIKHWIKNE